VSLTVDLLALELMCNVTRGTDKLPANFGASATLIPVELWANMNQTDDMTLLP